MIKIYKSYEDAPPRRGEDANAEAGEIVRDIIARVRAEGDRAVFEYAEKFDGARLASLRVSEAEIEEAFNSIDKDFIKTLEIAEANIRAFHERQRRGDFVISEREGVVLGQKITPLERVGVYVPGGTASYPSSVLMNSVPAKIAGVGEIIMATPPGPDGKINPAVLAAAKVAGVDAIYKIGGAVAVAALAYGTKSVPKVDKIVGPGNIYVATAKRMVYGAVGIDMIAGPSDILIIADGTADPRHAAADMLGQAEHDVLASAVLVCLSESFAKEAAAEIERQLSSLPRERIARAAIDNNSMIIVAENLSEAMEISNKIAPEHLELCVEEPFGLLGFVKNAGSIFLGKSTPEAVGDYIAGPNHTLPTEGTARFSSPLGVDDFIKKSSFCYYTKDALRKVSGRVTDFAQREGLQAHGKSVSIRSEDKEDE